MKWERRKARRRRARRREQVLLPLMMMHTEKTGPVERLPATELVAAVSES